MHVIGSTFTAHYTLCPHNGPSHSPSNPGKGQHFLPAQVFLAAAVCLDASAHNQNSQSGLFAKMIDGYLNFF